MMEFIGTALAGIGVILYFIFFIWVIVVAFQEGVLWGIAVLIVPFANIVFVITHWSDTKYAVFILLAALPFWGGGTYIQASVARQKLQNRVVEKMAEREVSLADQREKAEADAAKTEDVWEEAPAPEAAPPPAAPILPPSEGDLAAVPAAGADPALEAYAAQIVGEIFAMISPPPQLYPQGAEIHMNAASGELIYPVAEYQAAGLSPKEAAEKIKALYVKGQGGSPAASAVPAQQAAAPPPPPPAVAPPVAPAPAAAPPAAGAPPAAVDSAKLQFDLKPADLLIEQARKSWDKGDKRGSIVNAEKALRIYNRLLPPDDPRVKQTEEMIKAAKSQSGN